jgi:hypothetical protein
MDRLGQAMSFYKNAPRDKIVEFLSLRRCETSPFNGPVPAAGWSI